MDEAQETPADKLRMLATWLVEDSDLPEDEARDFAEAIDAVLAEVGA
jgi:hypothetical protein